MTADNVKPIDAIGTITETLLAAVKQRGENEEYDEAAWNRLVAVYSPLVYAWCKRRQLAEEDILDVTQTVFQAVARTIHKFRREGPSDTFRGWLWTITRSKIMDLFEKSARTANLLNDPSDPISSLSGQDPDLESEEDTNVLIQAIFDYASRRFKKDNWEAFVMSVVDGLDAATVADRLGIPRNRVFLRGPGSARD